MASLSIIYHLSKFEHSYHNYLRKHSQLLSNFRQSSKKNVIINITWCKNLYKMEPLHINLIDECNYVLMKLKIFKEWALYEDKQKQKLLCGLNILGYYYFANEKLFTDRVEFIHFQIFIIPVYHFYWLSIHFFKFIHTSNEYIYNVIANFNIITF